MIDCGVVRSDFINHWLMSSSARISSSRLIISLSVLMLMLMLVLVLVLLPVLVHISLHHVF